MKNIGQAGQAGAIAAALLLARFVGDLPWAHLDIAGPGRSAETTGYLSKGGTAFGVRAAPGATGGLRVERRAEELLIGQGGMPPAG